MGKVEYTTTDIQGFLGMSTRRQLALCVEHGIKIHRQGDRLGYDQENFDLLFSAWRRSWEVEKPDLSILKGAKKNE